MTPRTVTTADDVYDYIIHFSNINGYVPSLKDLQNKYGWRSKTAATKHIDRLVKKGRLEKTPRGGIKFPSSLRK